MPLRSTLVGATTGVVMLAGVVGFAVGLPEVTGDEIDAPSGSDGDQDAKSDGTPVADLLPVSLLGGALQRYPDIDPQYAEMSDEVEAYSGDKLTEAFGADAAVALYTTADIQTQVAVTLYDGESGLFLQQGPPVPPEMAAGSQTLSDVVKQGDSVCIGQWETQAYQQDGPPFQVQCQRVVDGRTINVYAAPGVSVEQAADIVDDVADQAGLG